MPGERYMYWNVNQSDRIRFALVHGHRSRIKYDSVKFLRSQVRNNTILQSTIESNQYMSDFIHVRESLADGIAVYKQNSFLRIPIVCTIAADLNAASIKKVISESSVKSEVPSKPLKASTKRSSSPAQSVPALVAIEIINDKENSSSTSKNTSKRTIESSLGYGYSHSPFGPEPPKKFVIYKYSQHDIPPYNPSGHAGLQNSIGYHLGSTSTHIEQQPSLEVKQPVYQAPTASQYYNPSATLYTTFNHQGQLGGLSQHIPYQNVDHTGMVPVIILRVYSNQLVSPDTALHTNLPQSHPYSGLNNVNLQELLQNYVHNYLQTNAHAYQRLYHSLQGAYAPDEYVSNLPTSENYPSNLHTRVIFHSNNNGHIPEYPKASYKTAGLSSYKTVPVANYKTSQPGYVEVQTPDSQYAYSAGSHQDQDQPYAYVYPSQLGQIAYYQQEQGYADSQGENIAPVPPTATQNSPDEPFNYHAHSHKQRRSKKNSGTVQSSLSTKKRELRLKTT
ncbi:hypothetical protein ILUMI_11044 [Ignelater luminosus]|uniref:Uncharacterized protein n=1 Tax=Ignelater luminosus TaxID=2038154 RepID=A0A8K0CWS6_IGNLU|nr:hypothetical protein ILUMI_11044 [Ignelater luminosus]